MLKDISKRDRGIW